MFFLEMPSDSKNYFGFVEEREHDRKSLTEFLTLENKLWSD